MRVLVTSLMAFGLFAGSAAWAAGNGNTPAGASQPTASADANASADPAPASPAASSAVETELQQMRDLLQQQSAQLQEQQKKVQALEEQLKTAKTATAAAGAPSTATSAVPVSPAAPTSASTAVASNVAFGSSAVHAAFGQPGEPQGAAVPESPLQLRIGNAYLTPVGFMDFTAMYRSSDAGNGIGTNFAGIPYGSVYQNNLSETRLNMQNSRIGFRVDADVKGAHVIGYMEADFLGNNSATVAVSSNSNTLRSRLYWVDVWKGSWELLGGQTWSLITPGRVGISPIPGDVFTTFDMDVNYQPGFVWSRNPELRIVYHPSSKAAIAIALDDPEQYIGGANGSSTPTLPAATALSGLAGTQLNNGTTTLNAPNLAPDIIAKVALDPSPKFHIEFGGIERQFKIWDPATNLTNSATGGGGFLNLNFQLFKGFRILANNFWSDGGGRYIFGSAPDLTIKPTGGISVMHSGATLDGFEYTYKNTVIYGYYGADYISKDVLTDTTGKLIGWGYTGSSTATSAGQNRSIQEPTFGVVQTFWKNPNYGALSLITQYSYLTRNPWYVAPAAPANADLSMIFLDLRYTLPGSAPTIGR